MNFRGSVVSAVIALSLVVAGCSSEVDEPSHDESSHDDEQPAEGAVATDTSALNTCWSRQIVVSTCGISNVSGWANGYHYSCNRKPWVGCNSTNRYSFWCCASVW